MRIIMKQNKNYEISNSISKSIVLITLSMLKLWSSYIFAMKKNEKISLLYSFNVQISEFLPFLHVDKNSLCTYN